MTSGLPTRESATPPVSLPSLALHPSMIPYRCQCSYVGAYTTVCFLFPQANLYLYQVPEEWGSSSENIYQKGIPAVP